MKRIGLLGGSFDPIHLGHLNLAFELMEKRELDQVWFIPAQINPLKKNQPPCPFDHRASMVQLAISEIPQFKLIASERERPPPSYMIDTLHALIAKEICEPFRYQFHLLLGQDALTDFFRWKAPEEIVRLAPPFIGSRSTCRPLDESFHAFICEGMTPIRLFDISATVVRERLAQKLYCGHLVSRPVLEYINRHQLYTRPLAAVPFI